MNPDTEKLIAHLLAPYPEQLLQVVEQLRTLIKQALPGVNEQVDMPARMIAFSFGLRYKEMICCIFPSKTGVKLSFYQGTELRDPKQLLEGNAKSSRYIHFKNLSSPLPTNDIELLLVDAYELYLQ